MGKGRGRIGKFPLPLGEGRGPLGVAEWEG